MDWLKPRTSGCRDQHMNFGGRDQHMKMPRNSKTSRYWVCIKVDFGTWSQHPHSWEGTVSKGGRKHPILESIPNASFEKRVWSMQCQAVPVVTSDVYGILSAHVGAYLTKGQADGHRSRWFKRNIITLDCTSKSQKFS